MKSRRQQQKHDQVKAEILAAARALMREQGVAALSMQELARRMGMRAPSLYNYFSNKMAIYDALFRLGFTLWRERLEQAIQRSSSFHDEINYLVEGYMSFALENPDLYQLCFERPVPGFVPSPESLALSFGILNDARQRVERYRSELSTDLSNEQVVDLVIAVVHGLTALHLANEPQLRRGQGRFGSLIPAAISMLEAALIKKG